MLYVNKNRRNAEYLNLNLDEENKVSEMKEEEELIKEYPQVCFDEENRGVFQLSFKTR